jgi:hypothetical protein
MEAVQSVKQWKRAVAPFLKSKAEELQIMGYEQATSEDVWNCLVDKVWKGHPNKRIYETAADIMHLNATVYLSYLTVQSYQNDDLKASIAALLDT